MTDQTHSDSTPETNNSTITEDCPCAACGQNLRGLTSNDLCPSCNEPVATTLEFAVDEALCMNCMKPNPSIAARCIHCGADLTTAGVNTDYAAGKPLLPSSVLVPETLEERVGHARSRMWIGIVFFGPAFLVCVQFPGDTIRQIARDPAGFFSSIGNIMVSILFTVLLGALAYLLYFLITRYWDLKGQLEEANQSAKPHNMDAEQE